MPDNISFENYNFTERDRYRQIRRGSDDVSFSYLTNHIIADMDDRVLAINVDDHFIRMWKMLEREEVSEDWKHPYLPYAGEVVVSPIGEQLIVFCETDLKSPMKLPLQLLSISEELRPNAPEAEDIQMSFNYNKTPSDTKKPSTDEELEIICYENYEYLPTVAGEVINSCLYVNVFPPLAYNRSYNMFKTYFCYLLDLQREYQKLLDFCFNTDFYKEDLDGITAASRFHLYCQTADANPQRSLNMSFQFSRVGFGNAKEIIRDKQAYDDFKKNPAAKLKIPEREANAFERAYHINPIATELARFAPVPIFLSYECRSLEDVLYLEFEKMLELDLRIKKCKNCGRYFILKGNYQTEYCDRIPEGETQNCQSISATAKYAQKIKDNPALALFNKAYKRYHARMKVGSVKPDAFKRWKYEAVVMRDKCLNGEMSISEFEEWLDRYFG